MKEIKFECFRLAFSRPELNTSQAMDLAKEMIGLINDEKAISVKSLNELSKDWMG